MFNKTSNPFSKPAVAPPTPQRDPLTPTRTAGIPGSAQTANPTPQAAAKPAEAPVEKKSPGSEAETGSRLIVGPDVKLKSAEILDCDTLVVEGRVEATMDSRVIRIDEQGLYTGKVSIDIAEIRGHFEGELTARSQLIIHATGKVSGKIRYGKMLIEEGGQISGEIHSLDEGETSTPRPRPEMLATVKTAVG